jgi:hypothetical protein
MRVMAFYAFLVLPIALWALLVLPVYLANIPDLASAIVYAVVAVSPIVGGDVSIFGEITPVILAGAIIALMPSSKGDIKISAIILAVIAYVLFIQLTVFFSSGRGVAILSATWDEISQPQKIILGLISNIRVMAIVVAASILGFKVKASN